MGREFLDLFNEWAESYDQTVSGIDPQYKEVFINYEGILESVSLQAFGDVLEFGVGTGNLTAAFLKKGLSVIGVEPSKEMRKIAQQKLSSANVKISDGDFLSFTVPENVDTIVSSYAFHHLTDVEKRQAFELYGTLLKRDGKIVVADTMFESVHTHSTIIKESKEKGFDRLAEDLATEYYTTIPILKEMAEATGYETSFEQLNRFVWLMVAIKK